MHTMRGVSLRPVVRCDLPLILSLFGDIERAHLWGQRRVCDEEQLLETWRYWSRERVGAKFIVTRGNRPLGLVFDYERSLEDGHTKVVTLLLSDDRAQGAGVFATTLFSQWLFENLPLRKVCFDVFGFNGSVVRMFTRLGIRQEMQRREHRYWNGRYWDQFGFALGREECQAIYTRYQSKRSSRSTPPAIPPAPQERCHDAALAALIG